MAPNFVLVALMSSVLLFYVRPIQSSRALPPRASVTMTGGPNYTDIAIVGEVFCKSCKLPGYVGNLDSSPVKDVVVRVSCFDKDWRLVSKSSTTNAGGFFYVTWTSEFGIFIPERCRAYADWSPLSFCNVQLYWPGTYGSYLYLVDEKLAPGGKRRTYSPGVIFLGQPQGAHCPVKH